MISDPAEAKQIGALLNSIKAINKKPGFCFVGLDRVWQGNWSAILGPIENIDAQDTQRDKHPFGRDCQRRSRGGNVVWNLYVLNCLKVMSDLSWHDTVDKYMYLDMLARTTEKLTLPFRGSQRFIGARKALSVGRPTLCCGRASLRIRFHRSRQPRVAASCAWPHARRRPGAVR